MLYQIKPPLMLEAKTILSGLFYIFGIPATILGIFLNMGTWKADALFILSAALIAVRIYFIIIERRQRQRDKEMDLEIKRHEINKRKKHDIN